MNISLLKTHLLMLLAIILAASSFPIGSAITKSLPPSVSMFLRFSFASLIFFPFIYYNNGFQKQTLTYYIKCAVLSLPLVIFFWSMFESLRYTSVINTGALYTFVPAITSLFAYIINKEIIARRKLFGLLLGTIGALWIVFRGSFDSFLNLDLNYGDLIFITGCVFLGSYNPLVKKLYDGNSMFTMTFWILLFGSIFLLILSFSSLFSIYWINIQYSVYYGLIYLAIFTTLVTFYIINYSTVKIGATKVSAYGFLTPLFVIIFGIIIDFQSFDPIILPGMILIVLSMIFIQRN